MAAYRRVYDSHHLQADCGISSGTLCWVIEYGQPLPLLCHLATAGALDSSLALDYCARYQVYKCMYVSMYAWLTWPGLGRGT